MNRDDVLMGGFVILAVLEGPSLGDEREGRRFYKMVAALLLNDSLGVQRMKE